MDQNQENIIKPINYKKNWYGYFCGDFQIWAKTSKIGARKWKGELQSANQLGSDTKMM
jgi:hypothetical protein